MYGIFRLHLGSFGGKMSKWSTIYWVSGSWFMKQPPYNRVVFSSPTYYTLNKKTGPLLSLLTWKCLGRLSKHQGMNIKNRFEVYHGVFFSQGFGYPMHYYKEVLGVLSSVCCFHQHVTFILIHSRVYSQVDVIFTLIHMQVVPISEYLATTGSMQRPIPWTSCRPLCRVMDRTKAPLLRARLLLLVVVRELMLLSFLSRSFMIKNPINKWFL